MISSSWVFFQLLNVYLYKRSCVVALHSYRVAGAVVEAYSQEEEVVISYVNLFKSFGLKDTDESMPPELTDIYPQRNRHFSIPSNQS
jgi:hypothetical protein